jgi:mandelate racemase
VQIGENFSLVAGMQTALNAKACDLVMPDLERIGGVTGWQQAASFAAKRKIKMSSHLYSEVSAHLLAVTPTAHYLEYVDWADKVVQEPLQIVDGEAVISDRPGSGIVWDKSAVEKYRI